MKKTTWKKIVSFVLVAALVISVGHFGGTKVKAELTQEPVATAESNYYDGSGYGDLTPSITYQINHTPGVEEVDNTVYVVLALDISSSMVKNDMSGETTGIGTPDRFGNYSEYDKSASRIPEAAEAAREFVNSLDDNVVVTVIGFNGEIISGSDYPADVDTPIEQINYLEKIASSGTTGTNIIGAVEDGVTDLGSHEDSIEKFLEEESGNVNSGNEFLVIFCDGDPYKSNTNKDTYKADTIKELISAKSSVNILAINYDDASSVFTDESVDKVYSANDTESLNAVFNNIGKIINDNVYATTWVKAKVGKYVKFLGSESNVDGPDADGYITWLVPDYLEDDNAKNNTQISLPINFAVKIDYLAEDGTTKTLEATDTISDADKNALIKMLLDNQDDPEIHVSEVDGRRIIEIDVTSEAWLYYQFSESNPVGPIKVSNQATATIYDEEIPVPKKYDYTVKYVFGDNEVITSYSDTAEAGEITIKSLADAGVDTTKYELAGSEDFKRTVDANSDNVFVVELKKVQYDYTVKYVFGDNEVTSYSDKAEVGEITIKSLADAGVDTTKYELAGAENFKRTVAADSDNVFVVELKKVQYDYTVKYVFGDDVKATYSGKAEAGEITIKSLADAGVDTTKYELAGAESFKRTVAANSNNVFVVELKEIKEIITKPVEYDYTVKYVFGDNVEATYGGTAEAGEITIKSLADAGVDTSKFELAGEENFKRTVSSGENVFVVELKEVKYDYTVNYVFGDKLEATYDDSAKAGEITIKSLADAGVDTSKYELAGEESFKRFVSTGENVFVVELKEVKYDYTVNYVFGDKVEATYGDSAKAGEIIIKSLADAGVDTNKYELAGEESFKRTLTPDETVFTVQLKEVEKQPEPEPQPEPKPEPQPEPQPEPEPEPQPQPQPQPESDPEPVYESPETPAPATYTLTVKYVYSDGSEAAADVTRSLEAGALYSEVSPKIDGYTADRLLVEGTMGNGDVTIVVTYTKNAEPVEELDIEPVIETPEGAPEEEEEIEEIEEVEEEEEVEIEPVIETPEGAPEEEELDLEDIETPEGLPQTGTTSVLVFFGIGAACIILGGTMIIKVRRREEEM